jgi:sulfate adenylyltransferase
MVRLHELTSRTVTLLDGDRVRRELAQELGFSKEHRDMNILRLGYVASEITKHRGIAICARIAPYTDIRHLVREKVTQYGGFLEIYVSTSLEVCEKRDRKGLYAKARAGQLKGFTGIDDAYEVPPKPDITLDTAVLSPQESIETIINVLRDQGYLKI